MANTPSNQAAVVTPITGADWASSQQSVQTNLRNLASAINNLITSSGVSQLSADWVDVPYNGGAQIFSDVGPSSSNAVVLTNTGFTVAYLNLGAALLVNVQMEFVIQNNSVKEVRYPIPLPTGATLRRIPNLIGADGTTQHSCTGWYTNASSGTQAGLIAVFYNVTGGYFSMQRYDGTPKPVWTAAPPKVFQVGFSANVPIVPAAPSNLT